ncbi:MAG: mucoidy inhibitor MuiA family protein [Reichenbachiella sp.]|uniref:DUF4139 domain-containing protein n=1 Tax=Reichenbachiella sp. TaxID=2184521 RepID=UPI00326438B6
MKKIAFLLLVLSHQILAQTFKEKELKTKMDEVTVFLQGAQISRSGELELPAGHTQIVIKSLSPHMDDKSIQVKGLGDFTILSVNHKFNYLTSLKKDKKVDSLNAILDKVKLDLATKEARVSILKSKLDLLDENKNLGGLNSGASMSAIKQAIDFYDKELTSIKREEIAVKSSIKDLQEEQRRLILEIKRIQGKDELPSSEILVRIESKQKVSAKFKISYLVSNAGWYPKYDVRVASVEKPLELAYKADIYQNTGINWEKVSLRLSNGNPNQSGVAPELSPWYLNYAENTSYYRKAYNDAVATVRTVSGRIVDAEGHPLPGVNILVKGSTVGTITNMDGFYSLTLPNGATSLVVSYVGFATKELPITSGNISTQLDENTAQLSEVVSVGRSLSGRAAGVRIRGNSSFAKREKESNFVSTTTVENQTTVEFEVDKPYSIKSNGDKLTVDLNKYKIETQYEYYAVPKLDKDAFLIARIINWDQYNLLEGEANLYFEDAYIGRSILDAKSLEDTLNISLGRDKSIVIGRTKVDEFTKRRTIGANRIESRSFKISTRNKKSQAIKLTLYDQIPVSTNSDIVVNPIQLSNGTKEDSTGKIKWELKLAANQNSEFELSYEVKYPKNRRVNLE